MLLTKLQAIYFIFMGFWPLAHYRSFEAVTGQKEDVWLVKTIGWLFMVIGLQLWVNPSLGVAIMAVGSALTIAMADIYYSLVRGRISKIYALDAIPQLLFVVGWAMLMARQRNSI